ncbi:ribose-phosphate diphosphokinase [Paenibacillus sp. FSL R5-0527]|uniref:ribose-phosphate diphosphokinase n=1 Tax=Paenibacillus sp. FSL R5-0527 TaxID=2975321 RepID=UPI00097A89E9|nr:ribose-phosphate pyrophosphokinase [Paenibacillus macerans]
MAYSCSFNTEIKIFSGSANEDFTKNMCRHLGIEPGKSEVMKFSDGNTFVKIHETLRDKDVYIVQTIGMDPNNEFMELLFWIDAFKRASASTVTAIIPYFSYAKGDKKDEPRVSIRARVCADCIEVTGADRVLTMDLHSPQIQGFFKKPVDHLQSMEILCNRLRAMGLKDIVVVSPDTGFAKTARKFASCLNGSVAIGDKTRKDHTEKAEVLDIIGDVEGKTAVLVDDFTISCGTLIDAARVLKSRGAARIVACVTHSLLREDAVLRLEDSPIEKLLVTDTVDNPFISTSSKIEVVSVAEYFANAVKIIHERKSLSDIF